MNTETKLAIKKVAMAVAAFLAAWQAAGFDFEPRGILGAFTCAFLAQLNPAKPAPEDDAS